MSPHTPSITVDVHVDAADLGAALRADVDEGLTSQPKTLPPKWFYDDVGSRLFEEITRLEEYYPTRRERVILESRSDEIAAMTDADTLVEIGAGTSEKTRILLDALSLHGTLRRFVPFDVSEATLRRSATEIARDYPGVSVHAVAGDFERHLDRLPGGPRRLVAFLGGTIGNLEPDERVKFLGGIAATMGPADTLVLGTDLVKDPARLVAAYDDPGGVTAEFNRNVLAVVNDALGADFDPQCFEHVACWNPTEARIEMWLRTATEQRVKIPALDLVVDFFAGEAMRTEISYKFRRSQVIDELECAGLGLRGWWTDPAGDFALSLSTLS